MLPEPKPFRCRCCGRSLVETDGARLLLAACSISQPVILVCGGCGQRQTWRPVVALALVPQRDTLQSV